ncbi:MAG TPA: extracellular solute-binding protein [Anaeromyxobacteraceae bacterium]|nr:extracellular solute-binding protein [Anaeromyxobacteraceae bacterium]
MTLISRRRFLAEATVLSAGVAILPRPARAQQRTLRIMQWTHVVPEYDHWFDDVFCKQWGQRHDTRVVVDHISIGEINARAAAEVAAGRGHDLFMFLWPPAAFERQTIDHREVYEIAAARHGKPIDLAHKSTYNPRTKRYFAFSDSYVPAPGNYRQDLWSQVGYPNGPSSWDDLREGSRAIKEKSGHPCGLGLSHELDTNMTLRALLWSFGGSEQDAEGNVAINSPQTIEALKYMRALFKEAETPEVFTFDPTSNNRGILSGKLSFVQNAISVTRAAEKANLEMSRKIQLTPALQGPKQRIAAEHALSCYVIWSFAENKEGAKHFLVDYVDALGEAFRASEFYNFPCFPQTVPDLPGLIANDPSASPPDKYKVLANALDWTTNTGYPGYTTAAIDEAFNTFQLPTMFARVARDELTPAEAARAAERELKRIFAKWNHD